PNIIVAASSHGGTFHGLTPSADRRRSAIVLSPNFALTRRHTLCVVDKRILRPPQLKANRGAGQLEGVAETVHQIAGIVLRRLLGAGAEDDEGGRATLCLRHVAQFQAPAADQRRLVSLEGVLEPAVQLAGGDALVQT